MPEGPGAPGPSRRRASAIAAVDAWLCGLGSGARPLSAGELRAYASRAIAAGWRLPVEFADRQRILDLLVDDRFPRTSPLVALPDPPPFLTWPHLEQDGVLCLLPGNAAVAVSAPVDVVQHVLAEGCRLIEDCVAGANDDDFRTEFRSYWGWAATDGAPTLYSLVDPAPPTRPIRVCRGQRFYLLGDDDKQVLAWLENRFGDSKGQRRTTEPAVLLWLERPLLPREYPGTAAELLAIARRTTSGGVETLEGMAAARLDKLVAVLGAPTPNGPCLAGVTIPAPPRVRRGSSKGADPLTRGFRPGKVPPAIVVARFFGATSVARSSVERVDAAWVHGRGQDPRFPRLRAARVAVLGCGSVGAPVALMLAQAGVGRFVLVDPEKLEWANLGRHPLGAGAIGAFKARALADRLLADYPHLRGVVVDARRWEDVVRDKPDLLTTCDLVVSTMGDWAAEGSLNEWQLLAGRKPTVVYGWTEPHAAAGHAVAILPAGGCLQCGLTDSGAPLAPVTEWPSGEGRRQEPACGAFYQPYGPVELAHVVALVSETVLDCLLGRFTTSTHRVWVAPRSLLNAAGGGWTPTWSEIAGDRLRGGFVEELKWPRSHECRECTAEAA